MIIIIKLSNWTVASAHKRGLEPFGQIQFDVTVEQRILGLEQIESNAQVEYSGHEVTESQGTVLSHVPQDKDGQDFGIHLKAHFEQCVLQSFGFQDASLVFGMVFENRLPILQATHQVFKIVELQSSVARAL